MIAVRYKPSFIRQFKKLPEPLREEVLERMEIFRNNPNAPTLRVHKLSGSLKGSLSFSVNYRYRIVFEWEEKNVAALMSIGDHDVYKS